MPLDAALLLELTELLVMELMLLLLLVLELLELLNSTLDVELLLELELDSDETGHSST